MEKVKNQATARSLRASASPCRSGESPCPGKTPTGPILALLLLAVLTGCSGLKLERPLRVQDRDWPTFARTSGHISAVPNPVTPPLTLAWEVDISSGVGNGSPVVVESTMVIGNLRGEIHALNTRTGRRIGWVNLGDAIHGSLIADGSLLIVPVSTPQESMIGYDIVDGRVRWKLACGDVEVSPLLLGQKIYTGNIFGLFFCIGRMTGEELWRFEIPHNTRLKGIRSSPAGANGVVVFGADDGNIYALDAETGKTKWVTHADFSIAAPPAIDSGVVVISTLRGTVYGLDLASGLLLWTFHAESPIYGHALMVGDLAVIATTGGTMVALRRVDGTPAWSVTLGGPVNAGAAAAGEYIFVGTLKRELLALRVSDGSITWRQSLTGRIKTSPVIANGMVFVATDDRVVVAFRGAMP